MTEPGAQDPDLTEAVRSWGETFPAPSCSRPGCLRIAEPEGLCAPHKAAERRSRGLCANCGSPREWRPVMNALTGKQRRRNGLPVWQMVCQGCGRAQRPFAESE